MAEQHVAEVGQLVDTYLTTKDDMEPISRDELLQRAKAGLVTVLDVRRVAEYRAGHFAQRDQCPLEAAEKTSR